MSSASPLSYAAGLPSSSEPPDYAAAEKGGEGTRGKT